MIILFARRSESSRRIGFLWFTIHNMATEQNAEQVNKNAYFN